MNASKFMDKQIMDLSRSKSDLNITNNKSANDFLDLMNPQSEEDSDGGSSLKLNNNKDEILPSYDFHPIHRPAPAAGLSSSFSPSDAPAAATTSPRDSSRPWNSLDSKPNSSTFRSYSSVDPVEPEKVVTEKAHKLNDSAIVSEIDRTMKKYTDSLLQAIDGLSARLSQLESRTSRLEYGMDDLKVCIGNNHGSADGKMRQLENILLEVQSGMQDIKDKQEVMEGHMQLAKLQMSKIEKSSETPNAAHLEPAPQLSVSAPPQQSQLQQQFPMPASQPVPSLPPNSPLPPQQNIQPPPPMTAQFPPAQVPPVPQRDSYFPPPGQNQEAPSQQYQIPPPTQHQQQTPTPTPHPPQPQQYQPSPSPSYPQPLPPSQQPHPPVAPANAPPQFQPPMSHHPEENPYMPPQSYPTNPRQPTSQPPSGGVPHSQPYYGSPPPVYDAPPPPPSRSSSGFSSGYAPPSGPSEPYPYSSPPSHYGSGSSIKPQPHSSGVASSNYPKIPTARVLPQAIPTATGISDTPSSGGSGNRVPIDDVVDKVTGMGFPREHVRATVRRLTENGQSVDLNVVLDKLMNDGDVPPPRGWFGR